MQQSHPIFGTVSSLLPRIGNPVAAPTPPRPSSLHGRIPVKLLWQIHPRRRRHAG
ncbi:hypothetical protein BDY21DRAFT_344212 [Lineolata rhizophorae]|uniref:Uncharacterized protein n=1 Tax=Lineolata rhizophorae TaxID=578093 RepID=A0A6A6P290_9PEZI|nr:hypothetical protein BDY21DRAFT_344212 [Lineolata rhizophorae]